MPTINVSEGDKELFTHLKPAEKTHKEFFTEVIDTYQHADETVTIDTDAIVDRVSKEVASEVELSAYRGVTEAIEQANE